MNNNRGNNRRRGRGNRQNGGGQQLNRIDSRARGNAPQLLEKYRKLAHDAHLNGDRVQSEYYLQFADHYFRVIADQRQRQEEQRGRGRDDRWQEGADEADEGGDFGGVGDFPSFDQPSYSRAPREDRRSRDERGEGEGDSPRAEAEGSDDDAGEDSGANPYEPVENPFLRESRDRGERGERGESRGNRGLRPRRDRDDRRPSREPRDEDEPTGLDPSSLPPAISASRDDTSEAGSEAEAKPRRGRPRKKPSGDDAGEALESVS